MDQQRSEPAHVRQMSDQQDWLGGRLNLGFHNLRIILWQQAGNSLNAQWRQQMPRQNFRGFLRAQNPRVIDR